MKSRFFYGLIVFLFYLVNSVAFASVDNATVGNAYQRLEKMLPIYKKAATQPWSVLSIPSVLRKGFQSPAVVGLRERLCQIHELSCVEDKNNPLFDESLEDAVRSFQERHNLEPDGIVGRSTLAALNVSPKVRFHQIQLNLVRLKHLMKQAEDRYVWINVPDYRLRLVDNHQAVAIFPVIVGKPARKTPEINSKITRITVNPYWYVPPTILRQDIIPKASVQPGYLTQKHIRIFSTHSSCEISPFKINWSLVKCNPAGYIFRQDPGPDNALGQIKFEFSNPHAVYLHDTPMKGLFAEEKRLFSSGCVRLKDPLIFLSKLLDWDKTALNGQKSQLDEAIESGTTKTFALGNSIPIHVTYITAWVDTHNQLHFWDDVYQHDQQLMIQAKNQQEDLPTPV